MPAPDPKTSPARGGAPPPGAPLRALHVIPSVSRAHGGPSVAMATIETALARAGVAATTATTDDDGPGRRFDAAALPRPPAGVTRVYFAKRTEFYKIASGLVGWLWRHAPAYDLVHIHGLFSFASVAAALIAHWRGTPYVLRPLGALAAYGMGRRPLLKRLSLAVVEGPLLRRAAAVHFTSRQERDEALRLGVPMRAVVIPLGVEPAPPGDRAMLLREYPCLDGRRIVLSLSRLDPKKNIEGLLRAFARLEGRGLDASLVVAGAGDAAYVSSLAALAASLRIERRVVWLGEARGARKAAAFAAADLFVLPSFSENFGVAAVEALSAGAPCVLGRGVAIAGNVESAGAGVAVDPSPEAIAAALERLLRDDAARARMTGLARELAARDYSTEKMAGRLVELYRSLARRRVG